LKVFLIHNTETIGVSSWYIEQAFNRIKKPEDFHLFRPNKIMKQIAERKESPPDYFLIWEGNISDVQCTRDLANIKIPRIMWFSDSYPVKGYMDYFPFEITWAKNTKPDLILMAQYSKVKEMREATNIPTYWLPFAGDSLWHYEVDKNPNYDISYVGTINPNDDHADQQKAYHLSILSKEGFKIRAVISHDKGRSDYTFEWKINRPVLTEYSKEICRGKVGFNCNIAGDLTGRTFEIPLMNRTLLTNGGDGWQFIFRDWDNAVFYDVPSILISNMKHLLDNESERNKIARNGYETIIKNHTYEKRIEQIELLIDNKIDEYEKRLYGR